MINLENSMKLSLSNKSATAATTTSPVETSPNILSDDTESEKGADADFSDDYKEYDQFRQTYTNQHTVPGPRTAFDNSEKTYSIDLANTMNATRRFRDKRAMDGFVIRNADFYKYHYGDELQQAENRPWWGRGEY